MPETRSFLIIVRINSVMDSRFRGNDKFFCLGDKFTAAFGASTAEHLLAVGSRHALTESVSFFPNNIGWRLQVFLHSWEIITHGQMKSTKTKST